MRSRLPIKGGWLHAGTIHWGAANTEQLCSLQHTQALYMQDPGCDNAMITDPQPFTSNTLLTHCMVGKSQGITESADRRSTGKDIQNRGARTETLFETRRSVGAQSRVIVEEHRQWLDA